MSSKQRGIQSVEIAGQVLQAIVANGGPLILKEIAELVDIPPARIFTYLVSLTRVGLLKRNPYTQEYEPGPLSFRLGVAALHNLPKVRLAIPAADELGQHLGVNVFLTVWSRHGPTVVRYKEHGMILDIGFRLGTVMALTRTATGRLFAAFMPEDRCKEVLREQSFTRDSLKTYESEQFKKELANIRQNRLAIERGWPRPSVTAIAAPIFDTEGNLLLTITAFSSSTSFDEERITEVARSITKACDKLSALPNSK